MVISGINYEKTNNNISANNNNVTTAESTSNGDNTDNTESTDNSNNNNNEEVSDGDPQKRYTEENGKEITGITGTGFAQIINNRATVLVDTCEYPEEIDIRRAKEAKERAEEQLRQKQSIQEYHRSKASLARAMERLKAGRRDTPIGY
jgi:hypothetical protein